MPPERLERRRLGDSTTPADRLAAAQPGHVRALGYQSDVTATGRSLKILHVVDELTREPLADVVAHSTDAASTVAMLDKTAAARGCFPAYMRCDNGPQFTANALRDWCRFTGTGISYTEPGPPWQVVRTTICNVKNWQDGEMKKRWVAAGMLEAQRSFRRVRGYKQMPVLVAAPCRHAGVPVTPNNYDQQAA